MKRKRDHILPLLMLLMIPILFFYSIHIKSWFPVLGYSGSLVAFIGGRI